MHISDFLRPECVALRQQVDSLPAAIHCLVQQMAQRGNLADPAALEADVLAREASGTTCMGDGLAIPHAKSAAVRTAGLAALTLDPPLNCPTPDGQPVRLLFLIAAPAGADDLHVKVLAELAGLLMDRDFRAELLQADTPQDFCRRITMREAPAPQPAAAPAQPYRLLAVTACPTGLAHTYMAAEALQQAAQERGISIKIETNGASGVDNELTADDIAAAECIIVAADRTVSTARFMGKRLLNATASDALQNAGKLVERAAKGDAPVYRGGDALRTNDWSELGREAYRHLMNGVSRMLPFIVGGGVLIAASLLLKQFGASEDVSSMVKGIGDAAFTMIYPVLAAFVAYSIGDAAAFMPGLMGGYLAQTGMTMGNELSWISSGFWGALIAGFAAGLLVQLAKGLCRKMPEGLSQVMNSLVVPAASLLLVGMLMILVVNPPLGRFNYWLYVKLSGMGSGSRLLLGAVLGALMATDYGGPINKAAYLTGTLALVSQQYDIMAAVMAGGMVPPIGVALACIFFRDRFTPAEQRTAPQNLLMGASFVTEGALPFALRDPLRVSTSCMAGSGLAGLLSVALGCGVPAPHGGLFLLAVTTNPLGYLAALLAGSALTAVMLGVLKKPLRQEPKK